MIRLVSRNLNLSEQLEVDVELRRRSDVARALMEENAERLLYKVGTQASSSPTGAFFLFISFSFNSKIYVRHSLPLQGRHKDTNIISINQENNATTMPLPVRQVTLALPFIIYFALYIIIVNTSDTPIIEPTMIITGMMLS